MNENNQNDNQSNEEPQVVNNPFANISKEKNDVETQKKKNRIILIISSIVVGLLLIYIFIDFIGDSINNNPIKSETKENLNEVAVDLQTFITNNNLDSLDAYGKDELLRVAINHMCFGVYECKIVSADKVQKYIKNVFDKDINFSAYGTSSVSFCTGWTMVAYLINAGMSWYLLSTIISIKLYILN